MEELKGKRLADAIEAARSAGTPIESAVAAHRLLLCVASNLEAIMADDDQDNLFAAIEGAALDCWKPMEVIRHVGDMDYVLINGATEADFVAKRACDMSTDFIIGLLDDARRETQAA
jgi:hypothetical protein